MSGALRHGLSRRARGQARAFCGHDTRRSGAACGELNLLAFGTRCAPLQMPADFASELQAAITDRWALVADGSTPEDLARLGAASTRLVAAVDRV